MCRGDSADDVLTVLTMFLKSCLTFVHFFVTNSPFLPSPETWLRSHPSILRFRSPARPPACSLSLSHHSYSSGKKTERYAKTTKEKPRPALPRTQAIFILLLSKVDLNSDTISFLVEVSCVFEFVPLFLVFLLICLTSPVAFWR